MAHLEDMTPEQLREWERAEIEKSRRAFADQPLPEISRVKAADYPHFRRAGWGFSLVADAPVRLWRSSRSEAEAATVIGLRPVGDDGPLALVIRASDGTTWALRRHDGVAAWAERTSTRWATSGELQIPVTAWPVADPAADTVPAPDETREWLVQNAEHGEPE